MLANRFGGGIAGVLTGLALMVAGVALLVGTRDVLPAVVAAALCGILLFAGLVLAAASVWLPRALIWRRSPSGRGYVLTARYYRPPHEARGDLCWQCGARLSKHARICAICGATRPQRLQARSTLPPMKPTLRPWTRAAVVPEASPKLPRTQGASPFPLYMPDGWDQPVYTDGAPAIMPRGTHDAERAATPPNALASPDGTQSSSGARPVDSGPTSGLPPLPPLGDDR